MSVEKYRSMLSYLTDAQKCAYKCAWESCTTCRVRSPMNSAASLANEVGEATIYTILSNVEANYNSWSWRQISHELTNALNAAKDATRAAETQNAEDIRKAEASRQYAVSTGTEAISAAQQQAAAQVAAREAEEEEIRLREQASPFSRITKSRKREAC